MIVCSCHAATDRTVRACVSMGDETVDEIGARCGAGTDCGSCRPVIEQILDEASTPVPFPIAS